MENNTYVYILKDTLIKKNSLLDKLMELTQLQGKYLSEPEPDMESFEEMISKKDTYIMQINQLDEGFEKIFGYVKEELTAKKAEYKEIILLLQDLIRKITDKSTKLEVMERQNKARLELYFGAKKKEIKNFKLSSKTVANYYKNMFQPTSESFFIDKKK